MIEFVKNKAAKFSEPQIQILLAAYSNLFILVEMHFIHTTLVVHSETMIRTVKLLSRF